MAHEHRHIDVSTIPALVRLARAVAEDGQPRVLCSGDTELAILTPVRPPAENDVAGSAVDRSQLVPTSDQRRRRRHASVTDQTAGIFAAHAKTPPPSPRAEKDAFEQAVAEQVVKSLGE